MLTAVRIVGVFLLVLAVLSLVGIVVAGTDAFISPIAVTVRYILMTLAGIGFILIRKWGVLVYLGSLVINWINYFTLYEGQGSAGPIWLAIPIPLAICVLCYFAWNRLR